MLVHETHHISRALITSSLLPCVLDGFSGVRSGGSALSIPPAYSMFFFSFVTAGPVLLTFCLLMQIGRYSPSCLSLEARFRQLSSLLKLSTSCFLLQKILPRSAGIWSRRKKADQEWNGRKETDWLDSAGSIIATIHLRVRGKNSYEERGKELRHDESADVKTEHKMEQKNGLEVTK